MKITLDETKIPRDGFRSDHLLSRVRLGKVYKVMEQHQAHIKVKDDRKSDLWLSGNNIRKYFKEVV